MNGRRHGQTALTLTEDIISSRCLPWLPQEAAALGRRPQRRQESVSVSLVSGEEFCLFRHLVSLLCICICVSSLERTCSVSWT